MHAWGSVIVCRNDGWCRFSLSERWWRVKHTHTHTDLGMGNILSETRTIRQRRGLDFLLSVWVNLSQRSGGGQGRDLWPLSLQWLFMLVLKQFRRCNYDVKGKTLFLVHLLTSALTSLQQNKGLFIILVIFHLIWRRSQKFFSPNEKETMI